jgi:hypothetical protein
MIKKNYSESLRKVHPSFLTQEDNRVILIKLI